MNSLGTFRTQEAGFNLIAVSIMLTVGGLIMASMLPGNEAGDANAKILANQKKLDAVEDAMRAFMIANNGRRPCPADGQYDVNSANFGLEAANPGTCIGGTPAAPMGPDAGTGYVVGGVIPTKTLGLADDYAFDEWGRHFTYVVDKRATDSSYCVDLQIAGSGGVVIKNGSGTIIDNVMYAYISHGPDGHGTFPAQGSSVANRINSGSLDTDTLKNAGVDSSFVYNTTNFTNVKIRKDKTATFDDIVYYQSSLKNTCCLGGTASCRHTGFKVVGSSMMSVGVGVTLVGDFNGDGYDDVYFPNMWGAQTYIVWGRAAQAPGAAAIPAITGMNKTVISAYYGGLDAADVNGDGIKDLIITDNGGNVYVVYGHTGTWAATLDPAAQADGTHGFVIPPFCAASPGANTVFAADVTGHGNGKKDIIYSCWNTHNGDVYGIVNPGTFPASVTPVIDGTHGFDIYRAGVPMLGSWVWATSVGDFTGDGIDDIVIGDYNGGTGAGAAWAIIGHTGAWTASATVESYADGTQGFELIGDASVGFWSGSPAHAGTATAVGDLNGDGIGDIAVAAPGWSNNNVMDPSIGRVYVVFGHGLPWSATYDLDTVTSTAANGFHIDGAYFSVAMGAGGGGMAVCQMKIGGYRSIGIADVNGDGHKELIVGSDNSGGRGSHVYVFYGRQGTWSLPASISSLTSSQGTMIGSCTGYWDGNWYSYYGSVGISIGDVNGDGLADIVSGAMQDSGASILYNGYLLGNNDQFGAVYVVYGFTSARSLCWDPRTVK